MYASSIQKRQQLAHQMVSTNSHSGLQGPTRKEGQLLSMARRDIAKSLGLVAEEADEQDLWRLYNRSETLLPDGARVRNLLWRMDNQRRNQLKKKTSGMAPNTLVACPDYMHGLTESTESIAASENLSRQPIGMEGPFGPARLLLTASPKVAPSTTPGTGFHPATQAAQIHTTLVDARQQSFTNTQQQHWRRRSSSNTVVGADQTATAQSLASSLESARTLQTHVEDTRQMEIGTEATTKVGGDLELARPLEPWDMQIDPSLFWMGNVGWGQHNGVGAASQQGLNLLTQPPAGGGGHTNQQSHKQSPDISGALNTSEIIFDTRFIDARSNSTLQPQTADSRIPHSAQPFDLERLFLSPNSLLPHWPDESEAITQHL
ncbi:hypothetical protein H4R24_005395 [Coemansia sp. RSA 988]|nr:hypothetical protein H4R24_005395 [Coemansia sp. RSA 988]